MRTVKVAIVVLIVLAVVFGLPAFSYHPSVRNVDIQKGYGKGSEVVSVLLSAHRASVTDYSTSGYTCNVSRGAEAVPDLLKTNVTKIGYIDHVVDWWASIFRTGEVLTFPLVAVTICYASNSTRLMPDQHIPYTYGQTWTGAYLFNIDEGSRIHIQVQIYSEMSVSSYMGWYFTV
jgi:hypothetical protein